LALTSPATRALRLPRLIAHRGAAGQAPENTLAALRRAAELGARWVEFDVKLSRDGRLYLLHDDTLDRTTSGRGPAAPRAWAELAALDAGSWFGREFAGERIPELGDVLALLGELDLGANVEIKPCPGREAETGRAVAQALRRSWPAQLPVSLVSSFSEPALEAARAEAPELPRGLCFEGLPADWHERLRRLGGLTLTADQQPLDRAAVAAIKATGVTLALFTVNDRARAEQLLEWGADALFTDRLDLLAGL
jgi:glycerophosphoryl diester phosphodiesterase